jgi:hypothetical protein
MDGVYVKSVTLFMKVLLMVLQKKNSFYANLSIKIKGTYIIITNKFFRN